MKKLEKILLLIVIFVFTIIVFGAVAYFIYRNMQERQALMANPASQYCISHDGEWKQNNTPEGIQGLCAFPNGRVCDEWKYYSGGCTKEGYNIVLQTKTQCQNDSGCITPDVYLMRNNCPYSSKCIKGSCDVICPDGFVG
jgi:putative hemolysin